MVVHVILGEATAIETSWSHPTLNTYYIIYKTPPNDTISTIQRHLPIVSNTGFQMHIFLTTVGQQNHRLLPVEKSVRSEYCQNGTNMGTIRLVMMSRLRLSYK